jgi:hypothetical protein
MNELREGLIQILQDTYFKTYEVTADSIIDYLKDNIPNCAKCQEYTQVEKAKIEQARKDTAKEIFEFLKSKQLMTSEIPEEGKPYQFLGCYITKWGRTDEPTLGLCRLSEDEEYRSLKEKYLKE